MLVGVVRICWKDTRVEARHGEPMHPVCNGSMSNPIFTYLNIGSFDCCPGDTVVPRD